MAPNEAQTLGVMVAMTVAKVGSLSGQMQMAAPFQTGAESGFVGLPSLQTAQQGVFILCRLLREE